MIYSLKKIHIKFFLLSFFIASALVQGSLIQKTLAMENEEAPGMEMESEETSFVLRKRSRASHERDTHRESPYRTPPKKRPRASSYKENIPPHNSPYKEPEKKEESLDLLPSDPLPPNEHISWPKNVTNLQKLTMHIVQQGFYKPIVSEGSPKGRHESNPLKVDLTQITPEKMTTYKALGGITPPLRENLKSVMSEYSPVRNTGLFPASMPNTLSPVAIEVLRDRETIKKARETGAVIPLPPIAHLEPVEEETAEQRLARKEKQRVEFEAVEAQQGNFPQQLNEELETALKPWMPYFNYIEMKKDQYLKGAGSKLRWPDLVGAFLNYVAPHMARVEVEGYDVYFSLKTLNFKRENRSEINHQIMQSGSCPYGADGERMNYHHLCRLDPHVHKIRTDLDKVENNETPYIIVLIPEGIHKAYSGSLHLSNNTYVCPRKEIDRSLFGKSRKQFNKTIVAQFFYG